MCAGRPSALSADPLGTDAFVMNAWLSSVAEEGDSSSLALRLLNDALNHASERWPSAAVDRERQASFSSLGQQGIQWNFSQKRHACCGRHALCAAALAAEQLRECEQAGRERECGQCGLLTSTEA